jgi:hypothetical protein
MIQYWYYGAFLGMYLPVERETPLLPVKSELSSHGNNISILK